MPDLQLYDGGVYLDENGRPVCVKLSPSELDNGYHFKSVVLSVGERYNSSGSRFFDGRKLGPDLIREAPPVQLEKRKAYLRRDGARVTIGNFHGATYQWASCSDGLNRTSQDGRHAPLRHENCQPDPAMDLVAEWPDDSKPNSEAKEPPKSENADELVSWLVQFDGPIITSRRLSENEEYELANELLSGRLKMPDRCLVVAKNNTEAIEKAEARLDLWRHDDKSSTTKNKDNSNMDQSTEKSLVDSLGQISNSLAEHNKQTERQVNLLLRADRRGCNFHNALAAKSSRAALGWEPWTLLASLPIQAVAYPFVAIALSDAGLSEKAADETAWLASAAAAGFTAVRAGYLMATRMAANLKESRSFGT